MQLIPLASLVQALNGNTQCRFASLVYRSKESGELARHVVLLGFSYRNCVETSLAELQRVRPSLDGVSAIAADELLESFTKTLAGTQDKYTKAETYAATDIPGIKVNTVDNSLQLFGLAHAKTVLEPGTHKVVKSSEKTIAKNKLRAELPIGKFREFALDAGVIELAKVNGEVIEF